MTISQALRDSFTGLLDDLGNLSTKNNFVYRKKNAKFLHDLEF